MSPSPRLRCAIYTRKSTEEGLDQEFNSLDAQREACEAFITSQASLGWKLLPAHYDDGGISGGTMNRPALTRLLEDVKAGRVDVVVVYKIDRLTRSLADFAKIVDVFDAKGISFVSVTQAFNTTTSMGRLTLNVLLSFAQFEREVTAERIRDKIAASKKKGMWMGGLVPLGYDNRDRKLVVVENEAETVRTLFRLYLELKSVRALKERADALGLRSKRRLRTNGDAEVSIPSECGGSFTPGHLYQILSNPLYAGKVRHRGKILDGEHQAIIDAETFAAAQVLLTSQAPRRRSAKNQPEAHLLTGVLFDETGDRLSPSHATKGGKRYRYYISNRLMQKQRKDGEGWRIPADEIERLVQAEVARILGDRSGLIDLLQDQEEPESIPASQLQAAMAKAEEHHSRLAEAGDLVRSASLIRVFFRRITLLPDRIRYNVDRSSLLAWLLDQAAPASAPDRKPSIQSIEHPIALRRRGLELRLILEDSPPPSRAPDQNFVGLLKRSHRILAQLTDGSRRSLTEIAAINGTDVSEVSRILPLAFLSPEIVQAILAGHQPDELTAQSLSRMPDLPMLWIEQATSLGF